MGEGINDNCVFLDVPDSVQCSKPFGGSCLHILVYTVKASEKEEAREYSLVK
jgi:hypothetical protein